MSCSFNSSLHLHKLSTLPKITNIFLSFLPCKLLLIKLEPTWVVLPLHPPLVSLAEFISPFSALLLWSILASVIALLTLPWQTWVPWGHWLCFKSLYHFLVYSIVFGTWLSVQQYFVEYSHPQKEDYLQVCKSKIAWRDSGKKWHISKNAFRWKWQTTQLWGQTNRSYAAQSVPDNSIKVSDSIFLLQWNLVVARPPKL